MSANPSTLLAPVISAFPKYSGIFAALGALIADDAAPTPAPPPAPSPTPGGASILAGRFVMLGGNGAPGTFDFGDGAAPFNSLRGYVAAHVYDTPGSFIASVTLAGGTNPVATKTNITVVADTRPRVALAAGADLAAALAAIKTPTILLLPPGATFDLKTPAIISVDGVTLRAAPAASSAQNVAVPRIRRIASSGSYSTLVITGSDISIEGIEFDSDQPLKPGSNAKTGIYAINVAGRNLLVRNCTFRNVDDAMHCEPQASGLVILGCQFTNELRCCAAYLPAMQNVAILGITAAGSVCEHIVRLEGAQNVLVHGSDLANHDGKETIAIRTGDFVAVASNTLRAWARVSQGIAAAPAIYCRNILFTANHFAGLYPGGAWLTINPGSQSVVIDSNAFDVDAQQASVAVQAPVTDVTLTHNQLCLAAGATTCKPLVAPFGNPSFTETGTTTVPAGK